MASYTGGTAEKNRVAKLQKQREKGRAEVGNSYQDIANFNQYIAFVKCEPSLTITHT